MATYVNDLRLKEITTGDEAGTWGTSTNTNLELIAEAFSYGTEASFGSDADATTTIADGATDPARSLYLKVTSGASLTATRTLTIAPNTVSKIWIIENATSGSQSISISQGSGANVTIPNGDVKVIYTDGAGAGAAVVDAFSSLSVGDLTATNLAGTLSTAAQTNITSVGTLSSLTVSGDATFDTSTLKVDSTNNRVGIGTTSPSNALDVQTSAGKFSVEALGGGSVRLASNGSMGMNVAAGYSYEIDVGGSEVMRIDSSGNLLVGVTSTTIPGVSNTTAGTSLRGDDGSFFSRSLGSGDANFVMHINRSSANGNVLGFAYDGNLVGGIGTEGGDALYIQSGTTSGSGLHFHPTSGLIRPARNGATVDGVITLGQSARRFNNLYLAGGVYLGGTSSANQLDDYEEGTWTPTDTSGAGLTFETATAGRYIKTGSMVVAYFRIDYPTTSSSATAQIGGLPFASTSGGEPHRGGSGFGYSSLSGNTYLNKEKGNTNAYWWSGTGVYTNANLSQAIFQGFLIYSTQA